MDTTTQIKREDPHEHTHSTARHDHHHISTHKYIDPKTFNKEDPNVKLALDYHERPTAGKIGTQLTVAAETVHDLSLAYSPGVAEPVRAIAINKDDAYRYTAKGHTVAVISNGTAILGLGNLGALASKPVMEGKALLFKRYGGLDSVDIEIDTEDPDEFIDTVERIACSFGAINLEDIKAPECFMIEAALIERCPIPVFHDDQHGTAIVTAAALVNALHIQGKSLPSVQIVCLGAGAAAMACMNLLILMGAKQDRILMLDTHGVLRKTRTDLNPYKKRFTVDTNKVTLDDAIKDADVFIGVASADLLTPAMLLKMRDRPVVFACANPNPEIKPELAKETRQDALVATGRSDYPNQVNNVLGFPYIFRGALDVRSRRINTEMKIAATYALADLAKQPVPPSVEEIYGTRLSFGMDYIIPKPMDPRLLRVVAGAVAEAAIKTGVASCTELPKYD